MKPASFPLWLLASVFAIGPLGTGLAALDPTRDKTLYVVGTAHLDTQWNWTIQDTINSWIPATLHTNFAFFEKYPHYTFSFEGAFRYGLAKEYYPADYATLKNYVAQGRWRVTGSAFDACDVNIPSPESLIRQVLYANGFWKREFGKTSVDLFLPDCFGFGWAFPGVGAHCGLKGYSSCRVSQGAAIPMPFQNIGRWLGPDGSSVVAVVNPGWYSSSISGNLANSTYYNDRINNMYNASGLYLDYAYFGTGDQGGGPTDASVNWLEQSVTTTNGLLHVLSAGADQLFRDLTPAQVSQLPSYDGEILGELGPGSYSTHPELKLYNRQNEQRGDAAERACVAADWLQGGGTYPQERLTSAWERFLWHQFHDDLCGTSIPAAYTFTWNDDLLSLQDFAAEETHAAGVLARAMDTAVSGTPLLVCNALGIDREDLVEASVAFPSGLPAAVRVFDSAGNEVPSQAGLPSGDHLPVVFLARVPANGAAVFEVRPSALPCPLDGGLSVSSNSLQNARYRVQFDNHGDVASIFDRVHNRELLSAPIRWDFLADAGSAWQINYSSVASPPLSHLGGPATFSISEDGPARVALTIVRNNAGSTFTEKVRLATGAAGDRVEWDVAIQWNTLATLLKAEFPLSVANPWATYDLGLGAIQRTNNTPALYEVPAQQWTDLAGTDGTYGITIMNDCKYGWDKPNNNTLRLTVLHNPAMGSSYNYQGTNANGAQRLTFAVMGHANDWRAAGSPWAAARLNQPLQAFQTVPHPGSLGRSFSFLSCNNSNVMIKAIKKAESSSEVVVRLQELSGQPQTVQLACAAPITAARQVTGAEEPLGDLSPAGGTLSLSLTPFQPVTVALTLAPCSSPVPRTSSAAIALPFDLDAISPDGNRTDGNFDSGYTYPAELMPPVLVRDGIVFPLGSTNNGALNALSCHGQTITFNSLGYTNLYLLAASASNTTSGTFLVNGQEPATLKVPWFSGFIGQWQPPSVLTNQEAAWVCTHRHDGAGRNNAYNFCYLFKYRLDLPPNATSLVLPNRPNLRIFSLALARDTMAETFPAGGPLDRKLLPWAKAGPDRIVNADSPGGTASVALDGSASVSPDGVITSYQWFSNESLLALGPTAVVHLPIGTNTVLLAVTDNHGETGMDVTRVIVLPPLIITGAVIATNGESAPVTFQFSGEASGGGIFDSTDDHFGIISAQGENTGAGEVATNAFDNNVATKWLDFANAYPSTRSTWIQYQYAEGAQYAVNGYTITSANDATSYPGRNPTNWRLLASNNGGVSWDTLDVQTNQLFTGNFQKLSYTISNTVPYTRYRFQVDSVLNGTQAGCMQLAELEFLAAPPPYSYFWSFGDGATSPLQNPQHTYTNNGTYTVTLAALAGIYGGTNTFQVTVGPPLQAILAAAPLGGLAPLTVQFSGQGSGGRTNPVLFDTTGDHLGTVTAQGENAGLNGNWEVATNAFDDVTGTKWLDVTTNYPSTRQSWIHYQHASGRRYAARQYTVTSANDATTYPARNPANWRLLGSNNGGSSWDTLDLQTNQAFTANFQKLVYPLSNTNAYNLYRFQIDSVFNPPQATCMQLDELEFLALAPVYTYFWTFGDGTTSTLQNPVHTYASDDEYTVSLIVSDGLSSATNSVTIAARPPALAISAATGGMFQLTWPAWATNYDLWSATNLSPPVLWSPVTNAINNVDGKLTVALPQTGEASYYQLRGR